MTGMWVLLRKRERLMSRLFQYLYERRVSVKWVFFGSLALFVGADFFVTRPEVHFFGDSIPGFWSLFGLIVCWAMIFSCKWASRAFLEREEDYYDK
jgi:hypothetical protein